MSDRPAALDAWHRVAETRDPAGLDDLLDEGCVFRSPAVHTPQEGKALTTAYLSAALVVLGPTLTYRHEWWDDDSAVLEFTAELDGSEPPRHRHAALGSRRPAHRVHRDGPAVQGPHQADGADARGAHGLRDRWTGAILAAMAGLGHTLRALDAWRGRRSLDRQVRRRARADRTAGSPRWSRTDAPGRRRRGPLAEHVGEARPLAGAGPFDLIVDPTPDAEGEVDRFRESFLHLRPGGAYVVAGSSRQGAAGRLPRRRGELGR